MGSVFTTTSSRRFDLADQELFARLSGDRNPIHLDPIAARRTQAGAPVVHGMHLLLWSIEAVSAELGEPLRLSSLNVTFRHFLCISDEAQCTLQRKDSNTIRWKVTVNGIPVLKANAALSAPNTPSFHSALGWEAESDFSKARPDEVSFEEARQMRGRIGFATSAKVISEAFPMAAGAIGCGGVAVMAAASKLVGMSCPGLHSVFSSVAFAFQGGEDQKPGLSYEVVEADERFQLLQIAVAGVGVTGNIGAFVRPTPVRQLSVREVAALVGSQEFAGQIALIIGASRGLGELTAKVIAAGGGRVIATYASGEEDADLLSQDIQNFGSECQILRYDVRESPISQLREMKWLPDRLFYFATPKIFRQKRQGLDRSALEEFMEFYVYGFVEVCHFLLAQSDAPIAAYYPSTLAIESRPNNLTEYSMAKAAGELLCDDLQKSTSRLRILHTRLPRLATDQTNVIGAEPADGALPELLDVARRLSLFR